MAQNPKSKRLVPLLLGWFATNARDLPWRRTRDPYAIWVSEIMLQQTQVKTVIPYWNRWMRELPTIKAAANASAGKIHKLWQGLGYYTRVRNLQKAAKQIVAECRRRGNESRTENETEPPHVVSYKFPENFDDVLSLPGIGRYTAGAICSIAFNQPTPILDGNVIRVLTRIFGIRENPREKKTNACLWQMAEELVKSAAKLPFFHSSQREEALTKSDFRISLLTSAATCSYLNQSLMELGALVCTPRNPQCRICPVKKLCDAFRENRVDQLPNLGKRETATARRFAAFIVERNGHFLVRQRPAGVVNAHLWEFPNVEISNNKPDPKLAAKDIFGIAPVQIEPLSTVKHSITRYRITLEGYRISFVRQSPTTPHSDLKSGTGIARRSGKIGVWKSPAQMRRLAFTAAHKKLASLAANRILSGR
jgi:A/G-specific adenine glycosylase